MKKIFTLLLIIAPFISKAQPSQIAPIQEVDHIISLNNGALIVANFSNPTVYFTNGTEQGTTELATISTPVSSYEVLGDLTYLALTDGQIWVSDGTTAGTYQQDDFESVQDFSLHNGKLYTIVNDQNLIEYTAAIQRLI